MNISPLTYRLKQTAAKSRNFDSVSEYFAIPQEVRGTPEAAQYIIGMYQKLQKHPGAIFANGTYPVKKDRWKKVKAFLKKTLF